MRNVKPSYTSPFRAQTSSQATIPRRTGSSETTSTTLRCHQRTQHPGRPERSCQTHRLGRPSLYPPPIQLLRSVYCSSHEKGLVSSATPPGLSARLICAMQAAGSGTRHSRLAANTASKVPSDSGRLQASPCRGKGPKRIGNSLGPALIELEG